ncbi:MAG: hypothetical protein WCJ75_16750 [Desulfomonile sp.]
MGATLDDLGKKRPLDKIDAFRSAQQLQSLVGSTNLKGLDQALKTTSDLGYILNAQGGMKAAIDYARPLISSYGLGQGPEGQLEILKKIAAMSKHTIDRKLVEGKDLQLIMTQIAGPYAASGKPMETAFAHAGTLGSILGPQAGEVLKNIVGKQGKSFGEVMAKLAKEGFLENAMDATPREKGEMGLDPRVKVKSWADIPSERRQELDKAGKTIELEQSAWAARTMASGDLTGMMKKLSWGIDQLQSLQPKTGVDVSALIGEAFGENALKGIQTFVKEAASGSIARFEQELRKQDPAKVSEDLNAAQQSLGARYKIFQQQAGSLEAAFRRSFDPATSSLLDSWSEKLGGYKTLFDQANQGKMSQNIKDVVEGAGMGFSQQLFGKSSLDSVITDFIQNLGGGEWKAAGKKVGEAAASFYNAMSAFTDIMPRLQDIVAYLWSWLPEKAKQAFSEKARSEYALQNGPLISSQDELKRRGLSKDLGDREFTLGKPPSMSEAAEMAWSGLKNWFGERLGATDFKLQHQNLISPQMMTPVAPWLPPGGAWAPAAAGVPDTAQFSGDVNVNIDALQIDGERLANAITPRVTEKVRADFLSEEGRQRINSLDWRGEKF